EHIAMNKKSFEEQFKSCCNKPPFTEFGGKAQDGWVSVTETGLVRVFLISIFIRRLKFNSFR
ncbi:hypothetical protein AC249_AIPGENE22758, partial [Exaiptasia diaphana]